MPGERSGIYLAGGSDGDGYGGAQAGHIKKYGRNAAGFITGDRSLILFNGNARVIEMNVEDA